MIVGVEKVERCPQFRGVLIEGFHYNLRLSSGPSSQASILATKCSNLPAPRIIASGEGESKMYTLHGELSTSMVRGHE